MLHSTARGRGRFTTLLTNRTALAATLAFGALGARPAAAATLNVCPSGCTYATIQSAINAAAPGDTIQVAAGTYLENLTINKSLTLVGPNSTVAALPESGWVRGPEATVGLNNGSTRVTISGAVTVHVSGFRFVGPEMPILGAAGITSSGTASGSIRNNWFDKLANPQPYPPQLATSDIFLQNANAGVFEITGNRHDGPTGADPSDGVYAFSAINAWYLNDVIIHGNRIENYGFSGIQLETTKKATITSNWIKNVAANGIQVANGASLGPVIIKGNTVDHASAYYESSFDPDPIEADYCWAGIRVWQVSSSAPLITDVSNNKVMNTPARCGAIGFTGRTQQTVSRIYQNSLDASNPYGLMWLNYAVRAKRLASNTATLRLWSQTGDILAGTSIVVSGLGAPFDGTHVVTAIGTWLDPTGYPYKEISYAVTAADVADTNVAAGTAVPSARASAPMNAAQNWWGAAGGPGSAGASINDAGAAASTAPWIGMYAEQGAPAGYISGIGFWPRPAVAIDVRPGNSLNQVNTGAKQLVPIAILGRTDFDVRQVDTASVLARGAGPLESKTEFSDVNRDGIEDMTLYFRARDLEDPTPEECADPDARLTLEGYTYAGDEAFVGSDDVTWQGC